MRTNTETAGLFQPSALGPLRDGLMCGGGAEGYTDYPAPAGQPAGQPAGRHAG
ncbi:MULTISPECIES: hypothetical protein [unclassified Kitasatospora]|uniref:hypothetical protein n=1 Tax=unclassified Kitasatospora TaxID=2633591 RepID=UPI0033DCA203